MTPYLHFFNRSQWLLLRDSVPMTLTEGEIARLKGINEDLVPRKKWQKFISSHACLTSSVPTCAVRRCWSSLRTNGQRIPYIISIAGSVAVGKSNKLRKGCRLSRSRWPEHRSVELINNTRRLSAPQ